MDEKRSPHELVAEEVRVLLARRRISGRQAARDLGWTADFLWRRLDGQKPFDVNDLVALSDLLKVPLTSLFPQMILEGSGLPGGPNKSEYLSVAPACRFAIPDRRDKTPALPDPDDLSLAA